MPRQQSKESADPEQRTPALLTNADDDEGRKVLDAHGPHRLHAELLILHQAQLRALQINAF